MTSKRLHPKSQPAQKGAALIVSLIMMTVIMILAVAGLATSNSNLKSVANAQFKDEAIAAANVALEQVISSPFTTTPSAEEVTVDLNRDGVMDYTVQIAVPVCVQSKKIQGSAGFEYASSGASPGSGGGAVSYLTTWDIDASVQDPATGASVRIRQGVRVVLSEADNTANCT